MLETAYNRGPFIDSANRKYAYLGAPYCASSVSTILERSGAIKPSYRGAWAKAFADGTSVDARLVWEGKAKIPSDAVIVFTRKGGGHVEFYISDDGNSMKCFGFNTSPDNKAGSQWNGTWSGYKQRNMKKQLSPYNVFRVTHFTPVQYRQPCSRCSDNLSNNGSMSISPIDVRDESVTPYNRFRYSSSNKNPSSPARYSIRR